MKTSLLKKICAGLVLCIAVQSAVFVSAASKATLFAGDEEVGYWTPCTDTLKVVTDAGENAEISLYDLGSSILYESKSQCELEAVAEDDGYTLNLAESLIEGHQYKLVVDNKEILFKATTTGGKTEISDRIDFSEITVDDLNNATDAKPEKNTYVFGDSGLLITKNANETRISVANDETMPGGKGLQFIGRGTLDKEIIPGTLIREGKIRIDARVKVENGSFEMSTGNSSGALVPMLTIEHDSAEISYQNAVTASGIKTKAVASPVSGYAEISYEMNLDDRSVSYTINGEEGILDSGKMPYYNSKGSILTDGVGFIQLEGTAKNGEYVLDYVTTTTFADAPDAEKIILVDIDGNAVKAEKDGTVLPEIKEIQIKFNSDMDEEVLSCIKVLDSEGNEVPTEGEYNARTKIYTLTLPQYLGQLGEYTVNIPKDETGLVYGYSETFKAGEGRIAVEDFKLTDKSGNDVYSIGQLADGVIVIKLNVLNTKLEDDKMTIVYTESSDKLMTNMLCKEIEISKDNRKAEYTFEVNIEDTSQINEIKAMLWNDLEEHIPQYRAVAIY